jgi:2-methylcitrate dehydratase
MSEQLADFAVRANYEDIPEGSRHQLKIRVLDSLGCAIGALDGEPIRLIRKQIADFGGSPLCTLIGDATTAPDRAAFYNSALVRYLDFNDSYLAKGETCHPSDTLGAVMAATEYVAGSGRDLLVSLAVAYQVLCRLCDVAPVRAKGFDHTTLGSFALAAGMSRALGLSASKAINAIGICGTAFNALRVTRTGALSNWKGLAYPNTAFGCTQATFLALRGITGPREVFEGNKGFMDAISGHFSIDWCTEGLNAVDRTILKKYNAEIHAQSAIEGVLELKNTTHFKPDEVVRIEIDIFDVAYNIIGGGEEGEKVTVQTKEEADHSLPYMIAVAILDGQVMPEQYTLSRIQSSDVQNLLRKVTIRPSPELSQRFPNEMPCKINVWLTNGQHLFIEKMDYEGFYTRPMRWETVVHKFEKLSADYADSTLRKEIVDAVADLDSISIVDLMHVLAKVRTPGGASVGV